jgi:hypothetical protein
MRRFIGIVVFLLGALGLASLLDRPMDLARCLLFIVSAAAILAGALVFMFDKEA